MKIRVFLTLLLGVLVLSACQNEAFKGVNATSIKAYENKIGSEQGELQFTITDQETIDELLTDLRRSRTQDVSNADMKMPDLHLDFTRNDRVVLTVGYYTEPMDGARYLYQNKLYNVTTELP